MTRSGTIRLAGMLLLFLATSTNGIAQNAPPDHPLFQSEVHDIAPLLYDQEHVRLALRFEPEEGRLFGVLKTRIRPQTDTLATLVLNAGPMDIYSVQAGLLDSLRKDVAYSTNDGSLIISLDSLAPLEKPFEVQITYSAHPKTGMRFRKAPLEDSSYAAHIWTDGLPGNLPHWLPLIDNSADRVTSEILVTVPPNLAVLANGRLVEEMATDDGMALFHYIQDQPHAPRDIGLVIGYFHRARQAAPMPNGSSVILDTWTPSYSPARVQSAFADVPDMLRYFSERLDFGYPWPAYTQVVYDGLLLRDISHTGFSVVSDRVLKDERALLDESGTFEAATLVARQWAGHLVKEDFWSDVWMPESLSRFLGLLYVKESLGEAAYYEALDQMRRRYLEEAALYRRPLVWNQWDVPLTMFDEHSRSKGVWFFHALHQTLGDETFWAMLRNFIATNAFQSTSTDDLYDAVTGSTERSVDAFFDHWVYSAGHPVIRMNYQHDLVAETLYVAIEQVQEGYLVPPVYRGDVTLETYSLTGPSSYTPTLVTNDALVAIPMTINPRYVLLDPDHLYLAEKEVDQLAAAWITQLRYAANPLSQLEALEHLYAFADDPALLIGLQSALKSRPSPQIRAAIIRLVAALPPSDATRRTILEAFEDPDAYVKRTVLQCLERFEDRSDLTILAMETAQSAQSYLLQAQAVETLARINAPGARDIIESALITPSHRDIIRQTAIKSLSHLGLSTRDRIQKTTPYTTARHSTEVRMAAIGSLGELAALGNKASTQTLIELLEDPDPIIRQTAIQALGQSGGEEILDTLRTHLESETDVLVIHETRSTLRQVQVRMLQETSS